ncbi:MAG: SLC13 family permease, partial [Rhizobiales bacterium]|nr:SLC13 family permease [Hyphomicrobiales bacterium]
MISDQNFLFLLLFFVFVLLIWGRWRYDLVAFAALCIALIVGVVPKEDAFSGFGHPATVIVALVLIVSRALSNSGAIELLARYLVDASRSLGSHIGIMSGLAAALSAVMNNVAALALLMPIDLQAASKAKRSPALTLMPISFASILGGMITLIGTPPNIVISEFRGRALGESYAMFDFAPVGLVCAVVGVAFIALIGWRLIPTQWREQDGGKDLFDLKDYIAELSVPAGSSAIGKAVRALDDAADDCEASIIGLIRGGQRLPGMARRTVIDEGDLLVVKAAPSALDKLAGALKLEITSSEMAKAMLESSDDVTMIEVVVPEGSRIEGRSALTLGLLYQHGVSLLGVSRQGRHFSERVRRLTIRAGDVLLLLGPSERLGEITSWLGALPLA